MNLFETLKLLQDFRSQLEIWGVTSTYLWAAGFASLFFLALSTREVLGWYLRTNQLRDEVKAMRGQLTDMQKMLEKMGETQIAATKRDEAQEPEESDPKAFRLTHWRNSL